MSPLKPLVDLIPAAKRKIVYAALAALVFLYGLWQAVDGDWTQFIVSIVTSSVGLLATANTNVKKEESEEESEGTDEEELDGGESEPR